MGRALLKGDNEALEHHLQASTTAISRDLYWWSIAATVARLDALVQLGDEEGVEKEAEPLLAHPGTYVNRSPCARSDAFGTTPF